jgi:hypothetical protein
MNDKESPTLIERLTQPDHAKYYLIGAGVVLAGIVAILALGGSRRTDPDKPRGDGVRLDDEDQIQNVRETLKKSTDQNSCKEVIARLNRYLAKQSAQVKVPAEQVKDLERRVSMLKERSQLTEDDLAEVTTNSFTPLDAQHLDLCYLMRDASRAICPATNGAPLHRAIAAFAWTVRHVMIHAGDIRETNPLPPQFVLRRGWGSAQERALVFLALLPQLDLTGCLIVAPGFGKGEFPLWACGVLVDGDIYLFDPRMGIPLPGRDGNGVATLAAVRQQPELLAQFNVDNGHGYDVSADQVGAAEIYLVCPLSALAPRMRLLEQLLQDPDTPGPRVKGRLAADPANMVSLLENAGGKGGSESARVKVWSNGTLAARRFLPPDEGGVDKPRTGDDPRNTRLLRYELSSIPGGFPAILQDLPGLWGKYSGPFLEDLKPNSPREDLLRGRFAEASKKLTERRTTARDHYAKFRAIPNDQLGQRIQKMRDDFNRVVGTIKRGGQASEVERALADKSDLATEIDFLVAGFAARPRGADATYLLALCQHDQAERAQAVNEDASTAENAWKNAVEWWDTFLQDYGSEPLAAAARGQAARARQMVGDTQIAVELLNDLSGRLTPLEKTARLFQARQLGAATPR